MHGGGPHNHGKKDKIASVIYVTLTYAYCGIHIYISISMYIYMNVYKYMLM